MDTPLDDHLTCVWAIDRGPRDGMWAASCSSCGRLATPLRPTRGAAEADAAAHGTLVSEEDAKAVSMAALWVALDGTPCGVALERRAQERRARREGS